jgi:hypothetical protein
MRGAVILSRASIASPCRRINAKRFRRLIAPRRSFASLRMTEGARSAQDDKTLAERVRARSEQRSLAERPARAYWTLRTAERLRILE